MFIIIMILCVIQNIIETLFFYNVDFFWYILEYFFKNFLQNFNMQWFRNNKIEHRATRGKAFESFSEPKFLKEEVLVLASPKWIWRVKLVHQSREWENNLLLNIKKWKFIKNKDIYIYKYGKNSKYFKKEQI